MKNRIEETPVSDETLTAFVDGQLPDGEHAEVSERIGRSPGLRARADRLRGSAELVRNALDGTLREPLPEVLLAPLRTAQPADSDTGEKVVDLSKVRQSRRFTPFQGFGMAAAAYVTLVAGGLIGFWMHHNSAYSDGLDPRIARVLTTADSGTVVPIATGNGSADVLPLLTYVDNRGRHCRHYIHSESAPGRKQAFDGVACRKPSGDWSPVITVMIDATDTGDSVYTTASGGMTSPVDDFIKGSVAGAPVAGPAERDLIRSGWTGTDRN